MADLEARTRIETPDPRTPVEDSSAGVFTWRYPLPLNKRISLGRSPEHADWVVPEDTMISRRHAYLKWDGTILRVTCRGVEPGFGTPPQNLIWLSDRRGVSQCDVRAGEWFEIGQTRFTVRARTELPPESPVDATVVSRTAELARDELQKLSFPAPGSLLRAIELLPKYFATVTKESTLFRQLLKVILIALPEADGAAVVRLPPEGESDGLRLTVLEQNVRNGLPTMLSEFVPSRRLIRRAVREQKRSCLHIWSTKPVDFRQAASPEHNLTLGAMHQEGVTPWAICTPFLSGTTGEALYVSGRLRSDEVPAADQPFQYQKFTEIIVGLAEITLRNLHLTRLNEVVREAWPRAIHRYLNDPEKLEGMLRPSEKVVTVLFCDLRNYSGFAEKNKAQLIEAWERIQDALDTMGTAVTDRDGIVAGFRGDAVLGFWGWPEPQPEQVHKAMETALRIADRLPRGPTPLNCGLGLTHGRAVAGRLGAYDLAVLDLYGPVVNLAFRLEEMTKAFGVDIVVSEEFLSELNRNAPPRPLWRTRWLGRVRPRGMDEPLNVFELFEARAAYDSFGRQWAEAVEQFTRGDWDEAYARFSDVFGDDPAAQCIMRHMDRTRRRKPIDWDGAFLPRPPEGNTKG